MTCADKWKQRSPVMRYRMFCDEARLHGIRVPENGVHITFVLPMPTRWSKKKRAQLWTDNPINKSPIWTLKKISAGRLV